jgi:hypothetical protein
MLRQVMASRRIEIESLDFTCWILIRKSRLLIEENFRWVIAHKRHAIRREEAGKLDRQTENDKSISPETLFKEEVTTNIFGIPLG